MTVRGSGLTGGYWEPIPYSWPYPARKGHTRRSARGAAHWRLLSSITGRIDIYLERGKTETPDRGPARWFADNLGLFTKQTETYSVKEFLERYAKFLYEINHRSVLLIEIDYDETYVGKANKGLDELEDALSRAYENLASRRGGNKVLFSTFGRTSDVLKDGLEITLEAQYNRKHGQGKPGIEVRVLGIPSILVRRSQEGDKDYKARMKRLFRDPTNREREKFARRYENTAKILLKNYERHLCNFFDVAKKTRWLHLEWGNIGEDLKPRVKF